MTFERAEAFLLIAIIVIAAMDYIIVQHVPHIQKAHLLKKEFFKSARVFVKDSRAPLELIKLIDFMAQHINSGWPARRFARDLVFGRFREAERNPNQKLREFFAVVRDLPPDLHNNFLYVNCTFALATTYRSFSLGWAVRRTMAMWVPIKGEATPTIPDFVTPVCVADSNNIQVIVAEVAYSD